MQASPASGYPGHASVLRFVYRNESAAEIPEKKLNICLIDARRRGCPNNLLLGGTFTPVDDVLADRPMKEPGVLEHHAEETARRAALDVLDVHTVHGDPASAHVIEAPEQIDERGLPGTGRPHDSHRLPEWTSIVRSSMSGVSGL